MNLNIQAEFREQLHQAAQEVLRRVLLTQRLRGRSKRRSAQKGRRGFFRGAINCRILTTGALPSSNASSVCHS